MGDAVEKYNLNNKNMYNWREGINEMEKNWGMFTHIPGE